MALLPDGPSQFVIFDEVARTTNQTSPYFENTGGARGVRIFINSIAGTGFSTKFYIEIKDTKNDVYYGAESSDTLVATGKSYIDTYPASGSHVGRGFRVYVAHGNANAHTYTVTGEWLP